MANLSSHRQRVGLPLSTIEMPARSGAITQSARLGHERKKYAVWQVCALTLLRAFAINAITAFLLTGCASIGNIQLAAQAVQPAQLGLSGSTAEFPRADWWSRFEDPELNRLIELGLADNPGLQEAQARMNRAAAVVGVQQSNLEPKLSADMNSISQRFSNNDVYPPPLGGGVYTKNQAMLQGSYELDFFDRNRNELQAAIGQARAAEAQTQAARVLLAANVASSYFNLASLRAVGDVLERTLAQRRQIERLVSDRVHAGLETSVRQRQAQAEIPQIRLQLEQNVQAQDTARHALAALLGQGPQATATLAPHLHALSMPTLPSNIPAELVGRRPDVVASRWQVEAALAGVKAARAEFYPNINLTLFTGFTAFGFSRFLVPGSRVYGVGPAITLPIFEGGKLRANLRGQVFVADAAIHQYNATLVNAVREVADAISNRRSLQKQIVQQQAALMLVKDAYGLSQKRYEAGLGNYLDVLLTENSVLKLEQSGANLKAQALLDDVALILALGGGYVAASPPELPRSSRVAPITASSPALVRLPRNLAFDTTDNYITRILE